MTHEHEVELPSGERTKAGPGRRSHDARVGNKTVAAAVNAVRQERSDGLPAQLLKGLASLSGMSLADVRVHRRSPKPADVGAHAYAAGNEIHLAPGADRHLAHEAWHVVQQRQGRVRPTTTDRGVPINDDPALEKEATVRGEEAERWTGA